MAHIPHDIIIDILLQLPAKSLIRFRSVCKQWRDSIRDPTFIQTHLNRSIDGDSCNLFLTSQPCFCNKHESLYTPHTHIYTVEDDSFAPKPVEIDIPFDLSFDSSIVLGTCNGLVCLGRRRVVFLFNPSTREYKIARFKEDLSFGFKNVYGLGYDQFNEDYKLVQFIDAEEFDSEINIRSLNDNSCSTISNAPYEILDGKELGVYLNGVLHWLGYSIDNPTSVIIFSFDIREKVFQEMPRPVDKYDGITLGVLRGQLSVLCEFSTIGIEIWVMKSYGATDSWSKLFFIEKPVLTPA